MGAFGTLNERRQTVGFHLCDACQHRRKARPSAPTGGDCRVHPGLIYVRGSRTRTYSIVARGTQYTDMQSRLISTQTHGVKAHTSPADSSTHAAITSPAPPPCPSPHAPVALAFASPLRRPRSLPEGARRGACACHGVLLSVCVRLRLRCGSSHRRARAHAAPPSRPRPRAHQTARSGLRKGSGPAGASP